MLLNEQALDFTVLVNIFSFILPFPFSISNVLFPLWRKEKVKDNIKEAQWKADLHCSIKSTSLTKSEQ